MSFPRTPRKLKLLLVSGAAAALIVGGAAGVWFAEDCEICEAATTILLQSTVAQNCTINVTTDPNAGNLPLTASGAQHVQIGAAIQSCNKKVGYTLSLTSANCAAAPVGAKVVDPVSAESLAYSAEFVNPTTGGSTADVTGLLASACTGQIGRDVTNWKTNNETSTLFVNFTGDGGLAAGTYQDTLTVTMNIK